MNLFFLSNNTKECARYHCDKHVVKMILEYAQLLSTAHRLLDGHLVIVPTNGRKVRRYLLTDPDYDSILYKATHFNHPSSVWARDSIANYLFLYQLFCDLCDEYTYRYGKVHKTDSKLRSILKNPPQNIAITDFIDPPCCMPDSCIIAGDTVLSYRQYYKIEKYQMAKWTNRPIPEFMLENSLTNEEV